MKKKKNEKEVGKKKKHNIQFGSIATTVFSIVQ